MLQQHLTRYTDGLIDCQMPNPFLLQMGATPLPKDDYLALLAERRDWSIPTEMWLPRALVWPSEEQN
jgi:leucyl/phenylalanyl-tRNA--protein transferase